MADGEINLREGLIKSGKDARGAERGVRLAGGLLFGFRSLPVVFR